MANETYRPPTRRWEIVCVLLSLAVSLLALGLSITVLSRTEIQHSSLQERLYILEGKPNRPEHTADASAEFRSWSSNAHSERISRRSLAQAYSPVEHAQITAEMRQKMIAEIKSEIRTLMGSLNQIYCAKGEKIVTQGVKGERGLPGMMGRPGPSGERGPQGRPAEKGPKGDAGISVSGPTITTGPRSLTTTKGNTIVLSCQTEGLPTPTMTWERISGTLPSGRHVVHGNGTLVITETQVGDEGMYSCTARNVLGVTRAFASVGILVPVQFTQKPEDLIIEENSTASLNCQASGFPSPTITWSKESKSIKTKDGDKNPLIIHSVKSSDSGVYSCSAKNILNEVQASARLTVAQKLRFTVTPPAEMQSHVGKAIYLHCQAWSGLLIPIITWSRKGQSLPDQHEVLSNGTMVMNITSKANAGDYTCTAITSIASLNTSSLLGVFLRSCSELQMTGIKANGSYIIDPDGPDGIAAFSAYCDMTGKGGVGVTTISHDTEERTLVQGYIYRGSYYKRVNYTGITKRQIEALIRVSTNCEQFIKYECRHSVLLWHGYAYGWWVSRAGKKMSYWGGASPGTWKCACGMDNTCYAGLGCNCDANDPTWREDSGYLTDMAELPVSELRFGDTGDPRNERGFHTLGKFKCYGIA